MVSDSPWGDERSINSRSPPLPQTQTDTPQTSTGLFQISMDDAGVAG